MNADDYTPIDKTDKLLARLCREGYLVRTKEKEDGEEIIEFMVGPRGKIEVGSSGVAGLVREVYGRGRGAGAGAENEDGENGSTQLDREMRTEFEARLRQSLGIVGVREQEEEEERREQQQQQRAVNGRTAEETVRSARPSEAPRRSSRRATTVHESSSGESETEDSVKDESEDESD
jgi:hypothetical protein